MIGRFRRIDAVVAQEEQLDQIPSDQNVAPEQPLVASDEVQTMQSGIHEAAVQTEEEQSRCYADSWLFRISRAQPLC
jgi:hypothetical protein